MLYPALPPPAEPPRIVVTGAGVVSALGIGWEANELGFRAGRPAFRPVTQFDVSRQRVQVAAEVDLPDDLPQTCLAPRQVKRLDRASRMLLLAAVEAWRQTGWEAHEDIPWVLGTTAGGMSLGEAYFRQAVQSPLHHRGQPTRALLYQSHVQARLVADTIGFQGPVTIISNACASGANALGRAWELLRRGRAQRVLSGGYDALCQLVFSGFDSLRSMSPTTCRPFDARRDGLRLGEGAAVLALETLDSARRRGAEILGEIAGYATTIDLHHLTQPHPEGDAALACMTQACNSAEIGPAAVGYVNAHGTGTLLNDSSEAIAIRRWAGTCAAALPVSSSKAAVGHLLGAAGAIEAVVCLMAMRGKWLPPQLAFEIPDPVCTFSVLVKPRDAVVDVALSNSFGFGGVNATLVLRRWV